MIHVLAVIVGRPGRRTEILEKFAANVPAVRAEAGCIAYEATIDVPDFGPPQAPLGPDGFIVIERWADAAALRAHGAAPHMQAYAAATKELVASRTIHILAASP